MVMWTLTVWFWTMSTTVDPLPTTFVPAYAVAVTVCAGPAATCRLPTKFPETGSRVRSAAAAPTCTLTRVTLMLLVSGLTTVSTFPCGAAGVDVVLLLQAASAASSANVATLFMAPPRSCGFMEVIGSLAERVPDADRDREGVLERGAVETHGDEAEGRRRHRGGRGPVERPGAGR